MDSDERPLRPEHRPERDADLATDAEAGDVDRTATTRRPKSMAREIIETLLLALLIFLAVRAVVLNFRVDGSSMTPNLHSGDMVLVNRNAYLNFDAWALVDWLPGVEHDPNIVHPFSPPQRGDIVVLNPPLDDVSEPYIKRIVGLPGETIEIREDGLFIGGQRLEEPYLDGEVTRCAGQQFCGPLTVPEGSVFVLGDNRDNSEDSGDFGPVEIDSLIGKAWLVYWPWDSIGIVPHHDYPELNGE